MANDLSQQVAFWGMVATAATGVATFGQVAVTYMVARSIGKASALSESLQISRDIDTLWQDYNRQVITNPAFRSTLRSLESLSEDEKTTQVRHLIFYVLNIIYIAWTAQKTRRDNFGHSETIVRDHLSVLHSQRELTVAILNGNRGYNQLFVDECLRYFDTLDKRTSNTKRVTMASHNITVREPREEEWSAIQKLNLQIFEYELEHCEPTSNVDYPFSEEGVTYFRNAVERKEGFSAIVAESKGEIVGYAILKEIPAKDVTHRVGVKQFQLHTLAVDRKHRGHGIGSTLVDAAKQIAKENGANRMKVTAYAPNARARHLYEKNGFRELEVTLEVSLD